MKKYIPSLNGLRALSILLVIVDHLNYRSLGNHKIPFPLTIFFDADLGVNTFFVISGFLITRLLLIEEEETGGISLGNFYLRRMFRIFPAYYFLLIVYFVLQLFSVLHFSRESWLSSIFYYKYIAGPYTDWESGHFWSLSVEEHFYLFWPLAFVLFKKQRVYFSFLVILAIFAFRLNGYYGWVHRPYLTDPLSLFQRGDALMIGCLFALFEDKITPWVLKYSKTFLHPLAILALLLFLDNHAFLAEWNTKYRLHIGFAVIPLGIGTSVGTITNILLGILIIYSINVQGAWFRFLNLPVMNYIGKLSYSLYLWQELFMSHEIGIFGKFPVNIVCIFVAANFSYYVIEKPFLKLKARYEIKKRPVQTALSV